MKIRKMQFPADIDAVGEVSLESFQYPENPEWGIQAEEATDIRDQVQSIKRYWFLVRMGMLFSKSLRELLLGYVCEEDGQVVGTIMFQRRSTGVYYINDVNVLPTYRRRGIARLLVGAVLDDLRRRNARRALLHVIANNLPAYRLYESMGFEHYAGRVHLVSDVNAPPLEPFLPPDYEVVTLGLGDWEPEFVFEQRITPPGVRRYDPVVQDRYRRSRLVSLLEPLTGGKQVKIGLRTTVDKKNL